MFFICAIFIPVDTQFRMSILERLEQMEQRMAEITNQNPSSETMATRDGGLEGGGATDQQSQVRKKWSDLAWVKLTVNSVNRAVQVDNISPNRTFCH